MSRRSEEEAKERQRLKAVEDTAYEKRLKAYRRKDVVVSIIILIALLSILIALLSIPIGLLVLSLYIED